MGRILLAPLAVFLQFNLLGNELPVFARPIVDALTVPAGEFYELVLGHTAALYRRGVKSANQALPKILTNVVPGDTCF